ncbi:O-antigen ligase family protein [Acetivibrio clariflavus]|nr:O-antigen ligase family protein [Acetivibrio clariflavus]
MSKTSKPMKSVTSKSNMGDKKYLDIFKKLLFIGLLFVIFYTPYLRGLYFESEQVVTEIIVFSIFILFWIYKWLKRDRSFIKTPVEYAAIGLVLAYFLTIFTAVNPRLAVTEFLKYAMYFMVFLMISDFIKNEREREYLLWTIVASAFGVCVIGIDSAAGSKIVDLLNSIFGVLNINISFFGLFVDGRIHSTMQYPNAFAAYLLAVFFISVSLMMTSKKWVKSIASAISFILFTTFIFTISRGAYILLVLAIPFFLLLLPKGSKARGLYCVLTIGIISGAFSIILARFITQSSANKGIIWPLVIIGVVVSFFVRFTDDFAISCINRINLKVTIICSAVLVVIAAVASVNVLSASVPLQLEHSINEKEGFRGKTSIIKLEGNKKYKLVFKVDAKSENKNPFVYRVVLQTRNKAGITSGNEPILVNKQYDATNGLEEKEIVFTVPEDKEMINLSFQTYYGGTKVLIDDAKIYDYESGKEVKKLVLKYKYSFVESVVSRFSNITSDISYNSRIIFIKDGFKIFKDWWLIGAGGGAWRLLNFKYQSFLYWSTETHNYPLQVLVETGLIGIIILMLLFASIAFTFAKLCRKGEFEKDNGYISNVAVFTAIIFLIAHSVMDFDFSLSSIFLLAWQLVAVLNSGVRHYDLSVEYGLNKNNKQKIIKNNKLLNTNIKTLFYREINCYPLIMILVSIAILFWPIKFLRGQAYANDAFENFKENNLDKALLLMEKAVNTDNLNAKYVTGYMPIASKPDVRIGYLDLLISKAETVSKSSESNGNGEDKLALNSYISKAKELIKRVERQANYDADLALNLGIFYLKTTDKDKGIEYINKSVGLKPLVPTQWQYKANALYSLAMNFYQKGDIKNGLAYIDKILAIIDEAKKVNEQNLSPFMFTIETQKYLEKAYCIKNGIMDTDDIVFQSVFGMDIDNNNFADQLGVSDIAIVGNYLSEGIFRVSNQDQNLDPYIYTRTLDFEPNNVYKIEVKLANRENVESVPFLIPGVTNKIGQLVLNGDIYSAEVSVVATSEINRLYIYVKDNYDIESIRVIKK